LNSYKNLIPKIEDIGSVNKSPDILSLIDNFLFIASDYINFSINIEIKEKELCPDCLLEMEFNISENIYICSSCGFEKQVIDIDVDSLKEMKRMINKPKNYKSKEIFIKIMNKFQGKDCIVDQNLYEKINDYCIRYALPTRESVKNLELDEYGGKNGTSKKMMYNILKNIEEKEEYQNISVICSEYWGWELPDISCYENSLLSDYDEIERVLSGRKMNSQYRLFRQLKKLGYKCKEDNFKIVTTDGVLEELEILWEEVCNKLKWKYVGINDIDF
jgi:putative IMPACT (imprinted ancient) family translation regulator